MMKRLITCVSCQRKEEIWCFDEQIYALCKIDKESLQAECLIHPTEILKDTDYEVRQMVAWRDKLLILPVQLNQWWVIYDKNTGSLEYADFCRENYRSSAVVLIDDRLVLLPASIKDPVIMLDLQKREIIARKYIGNSCFILEDGMEIWEAREEQGNIFFLIRGTCYYGQIRDLEIHLVKICTPEPLLCADFCENNGWAVGSNGKYLYQFDEEGNLRKESLIDLKTEIARIIVKSKYIFLLPLEGNQIWIFDRKSEDVKNIQMKVEKDAAIFPPITGILDYWDYVEIKREIWLLPLRHPLLMIDKDTGRSQQKEITYTYRLSAEKYWSCCNYVRSIRKQPSFFIENTDGELEKYLELIQENSNLSKEEKECCGEAIWKTVVKINHG